MIGAGNKRAKVELSYNQWGRHVGRKDAPQGQTKPPEIPIVQMMSATADTGAITMDFERFSQTGGNLPQIKAKREVGQDIKTL